ncbi:neuropeptide CCHamide-1-like isoform X2 [Sitodiplosis mosellana]|nr:neuropeptide CCHamide-1-like isoform X2 [Sitodiplosis mosellana]XP_055322961.1 neuropeptide CCHamide-1-like isoform X2 [Sitodiplosis mosellana]
MKAVIYMIICLSFCSELIHCSCLSYGHSCWGAHGKRSSNDRSEPEPQQDRWALFRLMQEENDKVFGRDRIARVSADDSLDYNAKRVSNNFLNALRKRNLPLVILNAIDDVALPQEIQKPFEPSTTRKRRSYSGARNDVSRIRATTNKPNDSASPEYKYFSA